MGPGPREGLEARGGHRRRLPEPERGLEFTTGPRLSQGLGEAKGTGMDTAREEKVGETEAQNEDVWDRAIGYRGRSETMLRPRGPEVERSRPQVPWRKERAEPRSR